MSYGSQLVMPATLHCEAPNGAAPRSGLHAGIFRPPASPSMAASSYFGMSSTSVAGEATTPGSLTKRKRPLPERALTPLNDWAMTSDVNARMDDGMHDGDENATRAGGARERQYVLAGQIQTPNGDVNRQISDMMEDSTYSDVDYRRALGSKRVHDDLDSPRSFKTADSRLQTGSQAPTPGWSRAAFNTIGGVVGKVWEFCKGGAFKGFYAGGGTGYDIQTGQPTFSSQQSGGQVWCNEHDIPTLPDYSLNSIPGGFPDSDYAPFCYERETPESAPLPAAKRRQVANGTFNDELRKNWVMIDDSSEKQQTHFRVSRASAAPSPTPRPVMNRRISKPVSRLNAPSLARRASSRPSRASAAPLSNRESASFASPRSPATDQRPGTPSRIPLSTRPQSPSMNSSARLATPSQIPVPSSYSQRGHRRNHSAASASSVASAATGRVRRGQSNAHDLVQENSPRLDAEAKRMAAQRLEIEQEQDEKMNDWNARLKEMIRQGKEALGTTVEVEGGGDENGPDFWEDD